MWLYFEIEDLRFGIFQEGKMLEKLYNYWKYSLKSVTIKSKINDKQVWKIRTIKADKTYSIIDRKSSSIFFYYSSNYDFIELNSFIREIIVKLTMEKGWIWLHASSFKYRNKTYVVAGPKGFGKTTWLMYAVKKMGAKIIVNDQVPVNLKNGKLWTYRWRPDVKVSKNTINMLDMNIPIEENDSILRYMIFPNAMHSSIYDFEGHYKLTKQLVKPYVNDEIIQYEVDFENEIYELIVLTEENDEKIISSEIEKMNAIKLLEEDREFITPRKGSDWSKNYNYWNKRFTHSSISKNAYDKEDEIIKKMCTSIRIVKVNNRITIDKIGRMFREDECE